MHGIQLDRDYFQPTKIRRNDTDNIRTTAQAVRRSDGHMEVTLMNSIMNEYGVIGSLLIDSSLFPEAAGLPDDMFSSVPLQEIFRAMRRQYEESGSFDALIAPT